jgi:hypothetical protein
VQYETTVFDLMILVVEVTAVRECAKEEANEDGSGGSHEIVLVASAPNHEV